MELKIDTEFKNFLRELTPEEYTELDKQIVHDGLLSPICVWNGVIVDGHNRYQILKSHNMAIKDSDVREMHFADKAEAVIWICKNQMGRRNLTLEETRYLIGKRYEAEKAAHGGDRKSGAVKSSDQVGNLILAGRKKEIIAKETGTSQGYVSRAEQFAKGVDIAEEIQPGIKKDILKGEIKPTNQAVMDIAKAAPEERKELVENLSKPKKKQQAPQVELRNEGCTAKPIEPEIAQDEAASWTVDEVAATFLETFRDCRNTLRDILNEHIGIVIDPENRKTIMDMLSEAVTAMDDLRKEFTYE